MSTPPWRSRGHIVPRGTASGTADNSPTSAQQTHGGRSQAEEVTSWADETHELGRGQQYGNDRARNHWRGTSRGRGRGRGQDRTSNRHASQHDRGPHWSRRDPTDEERTYAKPSTTNATQQQSTSRAERFSRLKPANLDPLQEIGLPSKGDEKLLSLSVQESYFKLIQNRCLSLYGALPAVGLTQSQVSGADVDSKSPTTVESQMSIAVSKKSSIATGGSKGILTAAMRGLREGLYASQRRDAFAVDAYVFIVRASIYSDAGYEAYVPALRHLLYRLADHGSSNIMAGKVTTSEPADAAVIEREGTCVGANELITSELLEELATYYILDLACRRSAFREALEARQRWLSVSEQSSISATTTIETEGQTTPLSTQDKLNPPSFSSRVSSAPSRARIIVDLILRALIHGHWTSFWRARDLADVYQHRLIEMGSNAVRAHALACLGKTYLTVDKDYVRASAGGDDIKELIDHKEVTWEVEGDSVIIRKVVKKMK